MSRIHWVSRQNKLEIPRDKDEVNKREIHEFDGRSHDSDTMVVRRNRGQSIDLLRQSPSSKMEIFFRLFWF
jgi:hypothetical protein